MSGINLSLGVDVGVLNKPVAIQSRGDFTDALDRVGGRGGPLGAPNGIQPGHADPPGGNPPANPTGGADPGHGNPPPSGPTGGGPTGFNPPGDNPGDIGPPGGKPVGSDLPGTGQPGGNPGGFKAGGTDPGGFHAGGFNPGGFNPGGANPGGFNPAGTGGFAATGFNAAGFNPAGIDSARVAVDVTGAWNATASSMVQGPAMPPVSPSSQSERHSETTLSVTVRANGSVTVELTGSEYRAPSAPMPPVRLATGDPIAALSRSSAPPPNGTLLLPAALSVAQLPGMSLALGIEEGGALRLAPDPSTLRGGPPQAALAAFGAGTGTVSGSALAAAGDPWALLFMAFGGAAGIGGAISSSNTLDGTAANPNALSGNASTGNASAGATASETTLATASALGGPIATATLQSDGQDALARMVVLGKLAADSLPLLHETLLPSGRADSALLWRDAPAASAAARALIAELEAEIPLYALLGYQPMSEAQAKRLRLDGEVLLPRLFGHVAQLDLLLRDGPVLPPGRVLRRGIADDGAMLRQARALPIGTVFQELAVVSASLFPELGERGAGFLSRKLSSEIILSRGVRGLAMGDGSMILAPETRFLLAGRMRKTEGGSHLILFAFGAEDRAVLRPEWQH